MRNWIKMSTFEKKGRLYIWQTSLNYGLRLLRFRIHIEGWIKESDIIECALPHNPVSTC